MAHHRQEFGPDEPDIPLYIGYPIGAASLRRKLVRDLTGRTGLRLLREQSAGFRSSDRRVRRTLWKILAVQAVLFAASIAAGYPLVYPLLWFLPYLTVWRVINRLRSIAEHGGLEASSDRRVTTHSVSQHPIARFLLVPYNIGWHLAHHVDAGVPFRNLPRYHRAMIESGYVGTGVEYAELPHDLAGPRRRSPDLIRDSAAQVSWRRIASASAADRGAAAASRPATAPRWSSSERFWLSLRLPSMRSTATSTPTIPRSIAAT